MKTTSMFLTYLACILPIVSSTCYFPNGNTTNDAACNSNSTSSTCCGPGYACLSNNICALTENVNSDIMKTSPFYVRGGCTDKTWSSKDCPNFCKNATNGDNLGIGGMGLGRCDGEGQVNRFYCRNTETAELSDTVLCSSKQYYFEFSGKWTNCLIEEKRLTRIAIGFPTTVTVIGQIASQTPDSSSANTISSASSSPPTSSSTTNPSGSKEMKLGLGLGLGLGLPLLGALGLLLFLATGGRISRRSRFELDGVHTQTTAANSMHSWMPQRSKSRVGGELETVEISEVPASPMAYELSNKGSRD